jgi:ADP-L-glycero-D-manno-heptose 6-epimerase
MNLYGWSKHLFDLALLDRVEKKQKLPPQWAGLKFFNVFGPNEYHKGEMMSLLAKRFDDARAGKPIRLFKSDRDGIADGEQKRDFVFVDDVVSVVLWLLKSGVPNGIFNVGTGTARSFKDLMSAMFVALGKQPNLEYIEMPPALRGTYQYFTQADVAKLQGAGYNAGFTPLEDAVRSYVTQYLDREDRYR